MNYSVIEHREAGIDYTIFTGTERDCYIWMFYNTKEHPNNPNIRISILDSDVNCNSEPFTYTVEEVEGD